MPDLAEKVVFELRFICRLKEDGGWGGLERASWETWKRAVGGSIVILEMTVDGRLNSLPKFTW